MRARWLDAGSGAFLGSDPFLGQPGNPATLHRYAYAANNPVLFTDPSGLFLGGVAGVVAGLAVRGLVAGAAIGGLFGAAVGYHESVAGNRLEATLSGFVGGAAAGALLGAIGGGLFGWVLVTTTLAPLLAFGAFMFGVTFINVMGSLDLLSRQSPQGVQSKVVVL